jgi:transposase
MEKHTETFDLIIERGCGLDVHEKTVMATVKGTGLKQETREFRTFTNDLKKLKQWLKKMMIKYVAVESTGVYWKPIFNILGDEFEIILVNARHVKNVPGRKTDVKDSEWLAKLLISGLLKASFIPPRNIRELRDLTRYQGKLVNQVSSEKNRLHKVLEDCNIKLSSVVSDIQGASAKKIIDALVYENFKPEELLQFVHGRVKASREDIKEALTGEISEHHKFFLKTILDNIKKLEGTIEELDKRIAIYIKPFEAEVNLLKGISGVGEKGAIGIISEIGADMKQFPDEQHLTKWAGMCPGNNETGGKKKVAG